MSDARNVRIAGAAAWLAAAVLAVGAIRGQPAASTTAAPELVAEAKALAEQARPALETLTNKIKPAAVEAAATPSVAAAFDNDADDATFQDLLESEDWWKPYRKPGRVSALYGHDRVVAHLFPERPAPLPPALFAEGQTVAWLKGDGRLYAVAVAPVSRSAKATAARARVILGLVVEPSRLHEIARAAGLTLGFSDGHRLVGGGGEFRALDALGSAIGRESTTPQLVGDRLPAVAVDLGYGLWVWAVGPRSLPLTPGQMVRVWLPWVAVAVLAVLGAFLLFIRARAMASPHTPVTLGQPHTSGAPPWRTSGGVSTQTGRFAFGPATAAALAEAEQDAVILGRYQLLEKIGEGGMAEVFLATLHGAEGFRRQVVVKRLHARYTRLREAVDQFIDEASLHASLSHSNIVSVFDFGRAEQDYFMAMEYVRGRDLERVLQRFQQRYGRPLDVPTAVFVVTEVLAALSYAHTKTAADGTPLHLVHRDVSLSNVLVSYAGDVKLSDFGIVKAGRRVSKTQVGMVKGNAGFMAPEQARGETVDSRADLFSTAAVLFTALTGQALYPGETLINQLLKASEGPTPQALERLAGVPPELALVLAKALAADPSQRFRTATEFSRALRPMTTISREDLSEVMHRLFADEIRYDVS